MIDEKRAISAPSVEHAEKKLKYPKSVFFIVSNEFCERFTFYGMRTILSIYLTDMLFFSEGDATIIYHTFIMLVYFFPVFGAMLADSLLGKFRTIFYISIVYAIGSVVLSLAATPVLHIPQIAFTMVGLSLIAVGTGGIKPCVSAFGGDQFILPQQELQLASFFSMFYFAINSGSLVSTFLTPILRDQECFGSKHCFTLAFGIPGILMIVSIIIFGAGKKLYIIKKPEGNMVIKVSKCIGHAISTKRKATVEKDHWMDYAEEEYGTKLVSDVKATLRVLFLYIPLPVFWALFDQQGTGWTFLARRMDGDLGFFTILPDQMQVINPILILIFIPLFQYGIYPLLTKLGLFKKPLQRLVVGGLLTAVAFCISAGVSIAIENEEPVLPTEGNGHLIVYNTMNCPMELTNNGVTNKIVPLGYYQTSIDFDSELHRVEYDVDVCGKVTQETFLLNQTEAYAFFYNNKAFKRTNESLAKNEKGYPSVVTYINGGDKTYPVQYVHDDGEVFVDVDSTNLERIAIEKPGEYRLKIGSSFQSSLIKLRLGAVYSVLVDMTNPNDVQMSVLEVTRRNDVNMLWLIPQYIIITMGEIMYSITGLEFSYSQAPTSMKSVLQAGWLLTTAFGNAIVIIIEAAVPFEKHSNNFFLYAGLMVADMIIFSLMAMRYEYVEKPKEEEDSLVMDRKDEKMNGISNVAFSEKET